MAEFVQEYAALRWSVVMAFLCTSAIVVVRLATPSAAGVMPRSAGDALAEYARRRDDSSSDGDGPNTCHESDAAHLIMCLVMLTMLVFPTGANPLALRGVLTAITVVFVVLLLGRIAEWHSEGRAMPADRMVALGYHVVAAGAMLYAMSGHRDGGHGGGPEPGPILGLAALFAVDAVAAIVAVSAGWRYHWLGHPVGAAAGARTGRMLSSAIVPHVVMDVGTAYMLIAVVYG
ncbi:DUF5134 domain-containing protein [Nocardia sp. NPDC057440]|uniref:DUF5134 domain-containing protein n=1 Tax=Nocardia sp. NPDC057440 TaxID=3346134 RepID=UPI00366FAD71